MTLGFILEALGAWRKLCSLFPKGTKIMNTNAVHNVINIAGGLVAIFGTVLTQIGCTTMPNGAYDCSASPVSPSWLPYVTAFGIFVAGSKIIINLTRDGFAGMWKQQPPVSDDVKTIVVATDKGSNVSQVNVTLPQEPGKKG